jgi:release factor glutamine methyltransferase
VLYLTNEVNRLKKDTTRQLIELLCQPLYKLYSGSLRNWKYYNLDLLVMPGIFHPGLFITSKMLLETLEATEVRGLRFLELGCGTGTQACRAAQLGAIAYASDITPAACANARYNADRNGLKVEVITADIFNHFPENLQFDLIFVNPPFLAQYPEEERDFAFCAGEEYEYYIGLFQDLRKHLASDGKLIMALAQSCDLDRILALADLEGFSYERLTSKRHWSETNHLYRFTA